MSPAKRRGPKPASAEQKRQAYDRKLANTTARAQARNQAGREIGEIPEVVDPVRKASCSHSLRNFAEQYFPALFYWKWGPVHEDFIADLEAAVLRGELRAFAMPRGSGKTTLNIVALLWALLYGHHRFAMIVAASKEKSDDLIATIKTILETNDLLLEDFPHMVFPIRCLDRISHRQKGQLYHGVPTRIEIGGDKLVFPTIPGDPASGAVLLTGGITGSTVRGPVHALDDGSIIRPTLVLVDDPSTRASAQSPSQNRNRLKTLNGDILYMVGPGKKVAGLCAVTVIEPDDVADRLLDREQNPEWHGKRTSFFISFPENMELWDQYAEIRLQAIREDKEPTEANQFYEKHRELMDRGAEVYWEARKNPGELSAIQHGMNLFYRDQDSFMSEYQNEPPENNENVKEILQIAELLPRVNGYKHGEIPDKCSHLVLGVDVQGKAFYWCLMASTPDYTASIIDYGTWPQQKTKSYRLAQLRSTLETRFPYASEEERLRRGLEELADFVFSKNHVNPDNKTIDVCLGGVDANWGTSRDTVYEMCKATSHPLTPVHGRYYGATRKPFNEVRKEKMERRGDHWKIPPRRPGIQQHVVFDTNYWKSFMASRLKTPPKESGALTIYGSPSHQHIHRDFWDQLLAERPQEVQTRDRTVFEWQLLPNRDNHFLDTVVICLMLLNASGCALKDSGKQRIAKRNSIVGKREKKKLSEIHEKRGG